MTTVLVSGASVAGLATTYWLERHDNDSKNTKLAELAT
jgi:2-polyprenyl-6-methoxyphenol hydroxylase-like FAD-dependent oxidoreductase